MSSDPNRPQLKFNPELWVRLRHVAAILMMGPYDSVTVVPHPVQDRVIFVVHLDEYTSKAAQIAVWRINSMNDLALIGEIKEQWERPKWHRV